MVVTAMLVAAAVLVGVPWPVVGVLAVGVLSPLLGAVLCAVLVAGSVVGGVRDRRDGGLADEAVWLAGVAAELRSGASLRTAFEAAAGRAPGLDLEAAVRLALTGAPLDDLADSVAGALPESAGLVAPAVRLAGRSGGRAAALFDRMAVRVWAEVDAQRELRTSTAQARLSALVVGGLPLVAMVLVGASGRADVLLASGPAGVAVMAVGLGLELVGLLVVAAMTRRTGR